MMKGKTNMTPRMDPLEPITVSWNLAELPTARHRTGLAGLAMMVERARHIQIEPDVVLEPVRLEATTVELRLNRKGLAALMDHVYGARLLEAESAEAAEPRGVGEPRGRQTRRLRHT